MMIRHCLFIMIVQCPSTFGFVLTFRQVLVFIVALRLRQCVGKPVGKDITTRISCKLLFDLLFLRRFHDRVVVPSPTQQ